MPNNDRQAEVLTSSEDNFKEDAESLDEEEVMTCDEESKGHSEILCLMMSIL